MSARAYARAISLLVSLVLVISISPAGGLPKRDQSQDLDGRWSFNNAEQCLMHKINRARTRQGKRRLSPDKQVGYVARRHAKSMAANYSVFHDYNMGQEITRWKALGQNSGSGGGCKKLFWAFMRSSKHRANIMGAWSYMGVGVERRNGKIFAQQVFESRYDPGNVYRYP